jgi:hypothetical protein
MHSPLLPGRWDDRTGAGHRHFQKPPDRLQFEPRNTSDVDCQMRNLNLPSLPRRTLCRDTEKLAPPAAVSPPATF